MNEQLDNLASALSSFACLEHAPQTPARAVGFHRHYGAALRNAVRALLATLGTAAVWYLTGWDQGPTLLAVLGPYCTLLATSPAPEQGITSLARGTFYGILAAAGCKFLLLPHISGFGLLTVVLTAFWAVGIHATTRPRHALQGIAYLITFNTLVGTAGTAQYDFTDFANQALAWLVTLAICLLAFQLLPGNPASHAHVLRKALHNDTRRLLRHGHRLDLLKWQATQQQRLVALQTVSGTDEAGAVSLQLGRQLRLLHRKTRDLEPDSLIARCAQTGARRISRYAAHSSVSAAQARRTSRSLTRLGAHELAACYQDLAGLLDQYTQVSANTTKVR